MEILFSCPLRVACTIVVSGVLVRTSATGRVRLTLSIIRTVPATWTSIRALGVFGLTEHATSDYLSALFANRIYPLCVMGKEQKLVGCDINSAKLLVALLSLLF